MLIIRRSLILTIWLLTVGICLGQQPPINRRPLYNWFDDFRWEMMETLDEAALERLPMDHDVLRAAYVWVFIAEGPPTGWLKSARRDLIRRGNAATPMLLRLFEENPRVQFRENLLSQIHLYPTVDREPYLEAARRMYATEYLNTPRRACYALAFLFEKSGTASDLQILEEIQREHPERELSSGLEGSIRRMKARLAK